MDDAPSEVWSEIEETIDEEIADWADAVIASMKDRHGDDTDGPVTPNRTKHFEPSTNGSH